MKCVNCKNCIGYENGLYMCLTPYGIETVDECVANDENLGCDLYEQDMDDDH